MAWNGSDRTGTATSMKPSKTVASTKRTYLRGLMAGLITVIVAGVAMWWLLREPDREQEKTAKPNTRSSIAETKPNIPSVEPRKPLKERVAESNERLSEAAKESLAKIDTIIREKQADTSGVVRLAAPLLKNPTDQLYFGVFNIPLGDMPPMTPFLQEEQEKQAVIDIGVELKEEETDTPQQKEAKALVNEVKKLLDEFIRNGGTINEFFDHYCYEIEKAFEFRNEAQRLLNNAVEEGDKEAAIALEKALNEKLDERGIKNIQLTENDIEVLDAIAEENETENVQ